MMNALEKENGILETDLINPSSLIDSGPSIKQDEHKSPTLLNTLTGAIRGSFPEQLGSTEEDHDERSALVEKLKELSIELPEYRFFGKSSEATMIKSVIAAKRNYAGDSKWHPGQMLRSFRPEFWKQQTVRHVLFLPPVIHLVTDNWQWEKLKDDNMSLRSFIYPPPDLAKDLIDNYFRLCNLYLPLLHRPTFEKGIGEHLHLSDVGFASVYLLVCSVGARFSDDPRVLSDTEENADTPGWKWCEQVIDIQKLRLSPPTLYGVQSYAVNISLDSLWFFDSP